MASQPALPFADLAYPNRPAFFAMRAIRGALAADLIGSHGPRAFALYVVIAEMEDQLRYRRPPNYTNRQLGDAIGVHQDSVDAVRQPLVTAGWLNYESRHRRPGLYWVLVPPAWEEAAGLTGVWPVSTPDNTPVKTPDKGPDNTPDLHSYSLTPDLSPPSPPAGVVADGELLELLKQAKVKVDPDHVLRRALNQGRSRDEIRSRIRYFLDQKVWNPGFLVFCLTNRSYVGRPADDGWPTPDPELVEAAKVQQRESAALAATERTRNEQQQMARLRQLTIEFGEHVRGRTPQEIVARYELPDRVRERLARYPTWERVNDSVLQLAVLERIALVLSDRTN